MFDNDEFLMTHNAFRAAGRSEPGGAEKGPTWKRICSRMPELSVAHDVALGVDNIHTFSTASPSFLSLDAGDG